MRRLLVLLAACGDNHVPDTHDAAPADADLSRCPSDMFLGTELASERWEVIGSSGAIGVSVADALWFDFTAGTSLGTKGIAARERIDLTGGELVARLLTAPSDPMTSTWLALVDAGDAPVLGVEIRGGTPRMVSVYVAGAQASNAAFDTANGYVRVRDLGSKIGVAFGPNETAFGDDFEYAKSSLANVRVEIFGMLYGATAQLTRSAWTRITVPCD